MSRPVALVTGASGGIGLELARLAAKDGHDLVLVARTTPKLEEVAKYLAGMYGISAQVLTADLADPAAPRAIVDELARRGITGVDVLVNNAGFAVPGLFVKSDLARTLDMLRLNVDAAVVLARLLLPGMVARDRGGVLTVASVAGFLASPVQSAYGGTKAFLRVWSHSLHAELKHTNVAITALCPGVTDTEFFDAAGFTKMTGFLRLRASAAKVARKGVDGLARGRMQVIPGLGNKSLMFARRLTTERFGAMVSRFLMMGRAKALRSRPGASSPGQEP